MPDFKLPSLGEDIQEADVLKVLVSEGDTVAIDQPLIEIETEKATLDVPAEAAGTVTKVHVSEGQTINIGQVIVTIDSEASAESSNAGEPSDATTAEDDEPAAQEETPEPDASTEGEDEADEAGPEDEADKPEESDESTESQEPSSEPSEPAPRSEAPAANAGTAEPAERAVFASPSLRKFAREIGVDLAAVEGSGPGGRITEDDIKRAARDRSTADTVSAPPSATPNAATGPTAGFRDLPDFSQWGEVSREPLSRLRRTVARNMTQSWTEIPHVHLQHHADITAMEELRQEFKERAREAGGNLTISVMLLKVVAAALRAHPRVNASYDMEAQELILKDYVHIGVAVDTDRGLVVPKIEHVDEKNIIELSVELNEIAERARENKLTLDEMRGSTFTVTNLGSIGTGYFAPIINWPEIAVLGLGRAERQAVWNADRGAFEPRLIMPMTLGHDHRVLDGADGARFMAWIVEAIRNPMLMALEG